MELCPKKCIHMEIDAEGARFPVIREEQCISCQRCRKVCPSLNPPAFHRPAEAYAMWSEDPEVFQRQRFRRNRDGTVPVRAGKALVCRRGGDGSNVPRCVYSAKGPAGPQSLSKFEIHIQPSGRSSGENPGTPECRRDGTVYRNRLSVRRDTEQYR